MFERSPHPPRAYQRRAAQAIVDRALPEGTFVPVTVGGGKTMLSLAAIYALAKERALDTVLVIAPAYARSVWASSDPTIGHVAAYPDVPIAVSEYCAATPILPKQSATLQMVVTNYELVRRAHHLQRLIVWLKGRKTLVVCDESWNLYNPQALQTKAVQSLMHHADRGVLLNGTPGRPEQVYGQITVLNPQAYPVKNYHHWKARYAVMGGFQSREIVRYNPEREAERIAIESRYIVAPLESDVIELPELLPPVTIEAPLTGRTWDLYRQMRDEFVAALDSGECAVAPQAGVKFLRLQQILAGFVGGVEATDEGGVATIETREVGAEKLNATLAWLDGQRLDKAVLWGKFRPEMERLAREIELTGVRAHMLWGKPAGVRAKDHEAARTELKQLFAPRSTDTDRRVIVGHPAAGGAGLDFSGASTAVYLTNAPRLRVRQQSIGRIYRPGQKHKTTIADVVACGPKGQRTVDHAIIAALRAEQDVAEWTAAQWRAAVTGDFEAPTTWSTP
jgi:hypothetical protein